MDDVTRHQPGGLGCAPRDDRHYHSVRAPYAGYSPRQLGSEIQPQDAEPWHQVFFRRHQIAEAVGLFPALDHWDLHREALQPPADLQIDRPPDRPAIDVDIELAAVLHRFAVQ